MNPTLLRAFISVTLVAFAAAPTVFAGDHAPIFDKRAFEEAKKAAETDKKLFVVNATAVWCKPCKQMDQTTWRDEKVVSWFKDNGIAVVFDVDKDDTLFRTLEIKAVPTMVAFKDGREFDRVVGVKSPDEFLGWLEAIARGEKSTETSRKKDESADGKKVNVKRRMDHAEKLLDSGKFDEAADEYVWLWQHMLEHEMAMSGVRLSFMASDMQRLARQSDSAKKKFIALRDEAGKNLDSENVDSDDVIDWVALNKIVGEPGDTLRWYDKVKGKKRWRSIINRVADDIEELLIARDRWDDLGRLYADPMAEFRQRCELHKMMLARLDPAGRRTIEASFREKLGYLYAGLLADDRENHAAQLAEAARKFDESPDMLLALVETALEAEEPRLGHVQWLKEAEKTDSSLERLRMTVETALKSRE